MAVKKSIEERDQEINLFVSYLVDLKIRIDSGEAGLEDKKAQIEAKIKKLRHNRAISKCRQNASESMVVLNAKQKLILAKIEILKQKEIEKEKIRRAKQKIKEDKLDQKLARIKYENNRINEGKKASTTYFGVNQTKRESEIEDSIFN